MKPYVPMLFAALIAALLAGCGGKKSEPVSYAAKIQPILNEHCISCHNPERPEGKIILTTFDAMMASRTSPGKKPLVIPGEHTKSWLYILCSTNQAHYRMPPDSASATLLPKEELLLIAEWIKQGAQNN
jgi:hypothetical protein